MSATTKIPYQIILRPIVTEKTVAAGALNKYAFVVSRDANKYEIAHAIEQIQADAKNPVKVVSVNTLIVKGAARRGRFCQALQCRAHTRLEKGRRDFAGRPDH